MTYPTLKQRFIVPDLPHTDELIPYLRQIDKNRWYSNFGPLVRQFEADFIQLMGKEHKDSHPYGCAAMASGYYALAVGLRLLGIGEGSKVLVPSVTFPACGLVVQNIGAELLLSDVDPQSWLLTPDIARAAAKQHKIDAVMPVSLYGMGIPAEEWDQFTEETGIKVIIDAAAAIETQHYLKHGVVAHSLHALKPFGIGEGGLLITPNKDMANEARQSTNFGMQKRITSMRGENAKMSEYHAAVACAQIKRWPAIKERRQKVAEFYFKALANEIRATPHPKLQESIVSCLMISLKDPKAAEVFEALLERKIAAHRTYLPPLYTHPHFEKVPAVPLEGQTELIGAEWMEQHVLGLPFHAYMEEDEVQEYITALTSILDQLS